MTFKALGIIDPILKALKNEGYTHPTQIQEQAIPSLLEGRDLLGCAQTGTGKTAAFAVPIIQHIYNNKRNHNGPRRIKALIVTPTRELAIQISESFSAYARFTGIRNTVIFGGVKQGRQVDQLKKGVDILVATPGRLLDLIDQGIVTLDHVKYSVLDEADHMLDMGFIHDIRKIIAKLPQKRQSLFFSATMPPDIIALSKKILGNPLRITIKPEQATAERVDQALYYVAKQDKPKLLIHLIKTKEADSTLVFSRTKHGSDKIVKKLVKAGINAAAIHGNKSQNARQKALGNFKNGKVKVLVATDIAARGIDVDDLALVINYDLPNVPETYVHRIGRTGRAKASGLAISFCALEEKKCLRDIEKLIKQKITVVDDHPFPDDGTQETPKPQNDRSKPPHSRPQNRSKGQNSRRRKYYKGKNRRSSDSKNER